MYKNKKVKYDYKIIDTITAGIILYGWEVKSLDNNLSSLSGTYCVFNYNELILKNLDIRPRKIDINNHDINENRDKLLLVTKIQIRNLQKHIRNKGNSIVPYKLYRDNGKWKIDICLVVGRNKKDKREYIKQKDYKNERF